MSTDEAHKWGDPLADLPTPWPQIGPLLHLRDGHLVGIGMPAGAPETAMGGDLARHVASHSTHVLLYATQPQATEPVPNLTHIHSHRMTPQRIADQVASFAHTHRPVGLVVIDGFQQLQVDEDTLLTQPEQAEDAGRHLKILADGLAVVVTIPMPRAQPPEQPLRLSDLGLAAELVYHADTLALLERTAADNIDVLVAKDRHGPAPYKTTLPW